MLFKYERNSSYCGSPSCGDGEFEHDNGNCMGGFLTFGGLHWLDGVMAGCTGVWFGVLGCGAWNGGCGKQTHGNGQCRIGRIVC